MTEHISPEHSGFIAYKTCIHCYISWSCGADISDERYCL